MVGIGVDFGCGERLQNKARWLGLCVCQFRLSEHLGLWIGGSLWGGRSLHLLEQWV